MPTVAFAKVSERLANDIYQYSNGKIDVNNFYLELVSDDLNHAYKNHAFAKQDGNVDLSIENFNSIDGYFQAYSELVYAVKYSNGNTRIALKIDIDDGNVALVVATVSKSRNAILFKNMIGMTEESFEQKYSSYKKNNDPNSRGSNRSTIPLRDGVVYEGDVSPHP